jgi:MoxR-like ATPase
MPFIGPGSHRFLFIVVTYAEVEVMNAMPEEFRFSAEEVSKYLTDRLMHERAVRPAHRPGSIRKQLAGLRLAAGRKRLETVEQERLVGRVAALVLQKQDLIKQVIADGRTPAADGAMSRDAILKVMERLDGGDSLNLRGLLGGVGADQLRGESIGLAGEQLDETKKEIAGLMEDARIAHAYRKGLEERIRTIRTARNVEGLQGLMEKCELGRMQLVAGRSGEDLPLSSADLDAIKKYDALRQQCSDSIERLMAAEETFVEVKRRGLLEYRRQLMNGGFVKTATVKNEVLKVLSHLQLGIPVFLRGHLGVGKTELALHVCRNYLKCEPEFISGSEEATKYDIYGRTQIGVAGEQDKYREFRRRMDEYRRMNPEAGAAELKEVEKQYYQTIVVKGQATSFFQYGPLVVAMQEGRPLIIDEIDGIPHSILMRINHALTRRPGDRIRIQESGGDEITVQKGFCVLATGNVRSARYKREELDAAFLSRWWSEDIRYPPQGETYEILMAALIDRRGNLTVGGARDLDDVKRLTEAASEIQRIFMGEQLDYLGEGADAARGVPAGLHKTVLSLRHLWNIVRTWKARNFDRPIEHYILTEFIRPAVAEDQVYLVQLFCRFRFFKDWSVDQLEIPGLTEAKLLAFQGRQTTII